MNSFGQKILQFYHDIDHPSYLPPEVEVMLPFRQSSAIRVMQPFFEQLYSGNQERVMLLGINPGRFGGGVTGIPFTDPIRLEESCSIQNSFNKRQELSSKFIYYMIDAFGGPQVFYHHFYISAVCPIGFISNGKNLNYYDIRELQEQWEPFMVDCLKRQIACGCSQKIAYSIGQGKNMDFLKKINSEHHLFERIDTLPHPRWVMQYRLKKIDVYTQEYVDKLRPFMTT